MSMYTQGIHHPVDEAHHMLNLFASLGVKAVSLTFTNPAGDHVPALFRRAIRIEVLRRRLPAIFANTIQNKLNVIIRPVTGPVTFLQLDDLSLDAVDKVQPIAFMTLATSPGNHQSWLALAEPVDREFTRRLRQGLGADPAASGAVRLAGSLNFKAKYAPEFPCVTIVHSQAQRITTPIEIEQLHLLASHTPPRVPTRYSCEYRMAGPRAWPSYERCLQGAPMNRSGTARDISVCDFTWCMIAIGWGWSIESTMVRLMQESPKAQAEGQGYARRTAQRAAAAVAGNRASGTRRDPASGPARASPP